MPAFYAAAPQAAAPSTLTPDYQSKPVYASFNMAEAPPPYGYPGVGAPDVASFYDFEPYKAIPPPSATLFPPAVDFAVNPAGPMLRLPRPDRRIQPDKRQSTHVSKSKEQEVVGGVSAKLDYDIDIMTDFVSEMAAGIIHPGSKAPPNFRKWVLHVLNATRLPSATILMSLYYLSLRVRDLSAQCRHHPTERGTYQMLTVALILGSKFLDDNTFQNKSWAEVSSIKVAELNRDEREWLAAFGHRLHFHPNAPEGYNHWSDLWANYNIRMVAASTILHPLDTNVKRQRSMRQASRQVSVRQTPSPVNYQFGKSPFLGPQSDSYAPGFAPYDPWYSRSAVDRSPSTAPHTGPTTPEYYGGPSIWTPTPWGYQLPATGPYQTPYTMPFGLQYGWDGNGHGQGCGCHHCSRPVQHYVLPSRYGPLVAG